KRPVRKFLPGCHDPWYEQLVKLSASEDYTIGYFATISTPPFMSNNPLRVCLISREFPPDTGWGGIATFAKHLAYGLRDLGHEVVVVSLATGENKLVEQDGITVHRVKEHGFAGSLDMMSRC